MAVNARYCGPAARGPLLDSKPPNSVPSIAAYPGPGHREPGRAGRGAGSDGGVARFWRAAAGLGRRRCRCRCWANVPIDRFEPLQHLRKRRGAGLKSPAQFVQRLVLCFGIR